MRPNIRLHVALWKSQAAAAEAALSALSAVPRIAVVGDKKKTEEGEGAKGEQHPVSNVTPIKTCCIIYTGREEQHLSPVCQGAGDSL